MEESFRVRVDNTFGALASAPSSSASSSSSNAASSPSLRSLWSLTDEELERKKWNRERGDDGPKPYPPNLDGFFANRSKLPSPSQAERVGSKQDMEADLEELDDDGVDEEEEEGGKKRELVKPDDYNDEEWDIRSSIGLDCTLDFEEEEDKYDKVAVGMEKADDRLYMKDITGYSTDINFYDELPNTFKDASRDPRANHMAAILRLKEDAEAAGKFGSLQVSDTGLLVPSTQHMEEGINPKSILKRKESQIDQKTEKRVRFGPGCKDDSEEDYEGPKDVVGKCSIQTEKSEVSFPHQEASVVPDYIRNPSKYTHYTFDSSSDEDEESNKKAYMDFLNQVKSSNSMEQQQDYNSSNLPKSIAFTPKKKLGGASLKKGNEVALNQGDVDKEIIPTKGGPAVVIAAAEVQESEVCDMEEDEPESVATKNGSSRRQRRQYRTKADRELDEPIT